MADLPLPESCQAVHGSETDLLCALDVTCDGAAQTMRCYRSSGGAWQCTCEAPNADRTYFIEGAAGLDACAVGAGLCADSDSPRVLDPDSCTTTREELGTEFQAGVGTLQTCTTELQCQTPVPVDFAPGVRARMPGFAATHCVEVFTSGQTSGQMRVDCDTTGSLGSASHTVVARSVAAACRPILELYLSSTDPAFDGSKICTHQASDIGVSDSCMLIETCFDRAPVTSAVSLVKAEPATRAASCSHDDLDHLYCSCRFETSTGEVDTFSYDLGVSPRPATCDLEGCTLEMMAEPTEPGVCHVQQNSGEHDDDGCTDYFFCTQPATLAGRAVTISSSLNVRCARAEDDAFYCSCAAGDETATFPAGAVATSVDACALTRTECLMHMPLPVGPASYGAQAPDPLQDL